MERSKGRSNFEPDRNRHKPVTLYFQKSPRAHLSAILASSSRGLVTWFHFGNLALALSCLVRHLKCSAPLIVGAKSRSLTMSAVSSMFLRTLLCALIEERHFALSVGLRVSNLGLALNHQGQKLGPTQPSLRSPSAIKIRFFELPYLLGAGCPIITSVMDCTPSGFPGSPACEPSFCVWP